ncbi:MAG: hypothetical protein H0V45_07510 [Actinobacteria bacterium]|nr:hypothetical protein [Actinomycetota bacterium]
MTLSRQNITGIGVAAVVLTAVALAVANFVGSGDNGGGTEYALTLGGSLLLALALFGWVIPRTDRPARTGLMVGLMAILSLAAFWSGLPYVLGPAAVVLGLLGRTRTESRTQATMAVVLGALATIAGLTAIVLDQAM